MEIKEGASLQGLLLPMRPVLLAADGIWKKYEQELVVTSGTDGAHSAGSLHYYGLALDFRTRYFDDITRRKVGKELIEALGNHYDVVIHSSHIHVEYDPKPIKE